MNPTRILIVEDESIIARDIQRILEGLNYEVPTILATGEEAIQAVDRWQPNLVLMDINLKGMSGLQAAEHILAKHDLPIVYLTAYANETTLQRALQTHAYGYIIKPCEERELRAHIEMALQKHHLEKKLKESQARYQAIVEDQTELICRFRPDYTLTFVNAAYGRYFGQSCEALLEQHFLLSILYEDRPLLQQKLASLSADKPVITHECRANLASGSAEWLQWTIRALFNVQKQTIEFQAVGRDVTDRKLAEEQLLYAAWNDALTGLANRARLMHGLNQAAQRLKQDPNYSFVLLFLDLDRFKIINDSLGHPVGDQMLVAIARRLEASVRAEDLVARMGGDEFAILLENSPSADQIETIANDILNALSRPVNLKTAGNGEQAVFITASMGIIADTRRYEHPEDILRDADVAMYQAKASGKAHYELFHVQQHSHALSHLHLETDLWWAITRQQLVVYYQPIVNLGSGHITSVEALLRWQHPQAGLVLPQEFIHLAEETGLIIPIGEWILRTASIQARHWQNIGYTTLRLAVNVSARQFQQRTLLGIVKHVLAGTGLEANRLDLEITESIALKEDTFYLNDLQQLRSLGIHISVDDFGLGSSLDHLKRLPLDTLKVAPSFVRDIVNDKRDKAIITAMITMAHNLDLEVIAEGVETKAQLACLRAQGCDEVQGHLISPPLPAEAMETLLQTWPSWEGGKIEV